MSKAEETKLFSYFRPWALSWSQQVVAYPPWPVTVSVHSIRVFGSDSKSWPRDRGDIFFRFVRADGFSIRFCWGILRGVLQPCCRLKKLIICVSNSSISNHFCVESLWMPARFWTWGQKCDLAAQLEKQMHKKCRLIDAGQFEIKMSSWPD